MNNTATASFTVDGWDPQSTEKAEGTEFSRVLLGKTFTGGVEGTSTVEMLTAVNETSSAYVAFERLAVSVDGRKGGFVLHHSAGESGHHLIVLPGSGHGELSGITGTATITQDDEGNHTLTLNYEL
ncbi:DUF3224 domain-containing protein [Amycolatopsis regifaucium]|uniref:REJ domain-containing protein n=1 Tax=Amycolatopsis regifaucium TaxID=546365 RepID=A0A154MH67_9PSEU|nr:DUF3224 domain-containing protein [Amycolatopsis regifaucium]KZB83745.1 hypothetical protein AVL48_34660 [Amycolatopsis regifaucium]OKA06814.1 hypothetical protein ATP06_0219965 [Amycolatopsis regifaucium]SFH27313.1 Protein of unknown function [Amycolatopsis regifaucium]